MRNAAIVLALATFLAAPAAVHATTSVDLRITELLPSPDGAAGQREFIELHNAGSVSIDLAGWRLRDAPTASNTTNNFTFGPLTLGAGQRVVVWSNGSANAVGPSWSASNSKTVWNDAGDAATLLDPQGQVRDWVGYGSTTQTAPPGHAMTKPAAPVRGKSIQLQHGNWTAGDPTPGLAPGQQGGPATARVTNIAPTVALQAPSSVRPGQTVAVQLTVADDNGGLDIAAWKLMADGAVVRQGNGSFDDEIVVTAPMQAGHWTLTATALDGAGANATATQAVAVRQPRLVVSLPSGAVLRFPDLRPGDRNVTSSDAFALRNEGEDPATPLLDVSAFRAGSAEIAVDGNLWIGVTASGATTWVRYDAPLQPLPSLAPGTSATLALRIGAVPSPAPAGLYGTTFTVVAS